MCVELCACQIIHLLHVHRTCCALLPGTNEVKLYQLNTDTVINRAH